MNKAFVRESDQTAEYCPRCGSQEQPCVAAVQKYYFQCQKPKSLTVCSCLSE